MCFHKQVRILMNFPLISSGGYVSAVLVGLVQMLFVVDDQKKD